MPDFADELSQIRDQLGTTTTELSVRLPTSKEVAISLSAYGRLTRRIHELLDTNLSPLHILAAILALPVTVVPIGFLFWAGLMLFYGIGVLEMFGTGTVTIVSQLVAVSLGLSFLFLLGRYLARPTHLGVSPAGIRWHWFRSLWIQGKLMPWESMIGIELVQPAGKTSFEEQVLTFVGSGRRLSVKVGMIEDEQQFQYLKAVIKACPVQRDFALSQLLAQEDNSAYTQIWMEALTAAPDRQRLTPLPPGTLLQAGKYKVQKLIGAGGQGSAYLSERYGFGREAMPVVLKEYVLPVQVTNTAKTTALENLEREARILKAIDHPQIVQLLDFFVEDHRGYLALEFVEGPTLRYLVKTEGPQSPELVLDFALQICAILTYLHELSPPVIHRDVTPDNLILTRDNQLKLIDFNVAQQRATTTTATIVGKHAYIAPEQFRGKPVPQSDIYSLGATMSYLLQGKDPKPLSVLRPGTQPGVSDLLDEITAGCTAIDVANRYATAAAVADDLRALSEKLD